MLEAVAFAAERLLLATDWREAADEVLECLGPRSRVSRAYVIENHRNDEGRVLGTVQHEWCAPGIESQVGSPPLDGAPWDHRFARWAALHARSEPIVGDVADLPEAERRELESHGIASIAEVPIFVGDEWWGAIGFDDCERERRWTSELDALRAAATMIGAAVTRQRAERDRHLAERRWRQVIEHIPAVTYIDAVVGTGDVRMEFVSPQISTVLGYEPERFLEDPSIWFALIHPDDLARLEASGVLDATDTSTFDEVYRMRGADGDLSVDPRHLDARVPRRRGTRALPRIHDRRDRAHARAGAGRARPRSATGSSSSAPRRSPTPRRSSRPTSPTR